MKARIAQTAQQPRVLVAAGLALALTGALALHRTVGLTPARRAVCTQRRASKAMAR